LGRVDVDGVGIEYDVTGDGPPVVLLLQSVGEMPGLAGRRAWD